MTLRAAVVGGGVVSGRHLSGLEQNPRVGLVAVCDIDEEQARKQAEKYGIEAYFDMEELLRSERLDWIHLCTPVQTHRDLAIQAIEAGVAVQIEKPATVTVAEFEDITAAAEEHGVTVSVVRNHLFDIAAREALERIESGELGRVRGVDVIAAGKTEPHDENRGAWAFELPGGEFEEGIPHQIYLALTVGGFPRDHDAIDVTTALAGDYDGEFTYDGLQLQWVTDDEALCSVKLLAGGVPQRLLLVHGEDASLSVDLLSQTTTKLDRDYGASAAARAMSNVDHARGRIEGTLDHAVGMAKRKLSSDWETELEWNPHLYQFDEEARALLGGEDPPVSLAEVGWTIELMERVREQATDGESAETGRRGAIAERD